MQAAWDGHPTGCGGTAASSKVEWYIDRTGHSTHCMPNEAVLFRTSRPRELSRRAELWLRVDWNSLILRTVAVAAQAATIWITWPLWQVRHYSPHQLLPQIPNLPALPLPQVDVALWLLGSLVLVLVVPRWGVLLHGVVLVWAILLDQIRMQPECISLWVLMLGSLNSPGCKLLARSHLIALWFFAGFHKLVSPGYYESAVPFMLGRPPGASVATSDVLCGALAAVFEMALAVLAIVPKTRRQCAALAAPFHLFVVCWLAFRLQWNYSICPWNAAIAVDGFTLIWPWRTALLADWREVSRPIKTAVAFILFSPLLFYVALLDPFLCYCVYAENAPLAYTVKFPSEKPPSSPTGEPLSVPDARIFEISTLLPGLEVAIPPEHRLFCAYFELTSQPGETLVIEDRRLLARILGFDHRQIVKQPDTTVVP
jgi:hypothetical protein